MVSINYSSREVCCKIVYYGPGLSGKTTNLQYVHSKVPGNTRGDLISLATEADRTLYFDFLPINIGTINGFAAKFQLYTVPGQVYYNATRKLVLRGVDGVVFVADSQPDKLDENVESLMNLQENLEEYGYDINDLPMVIQYNKRDLPGVMPVQQLQDKLNPEGRPYYEASATVGNGIFDTLKLVIKLVLDKAKSAGTKAQPMPRTQPEAVAVAVPSSPTVAEGRPYPTAEPEPSSPTPQPVTSASAAASFQEPSPVAAAPSQPMAGAPPEPTEAPASTEIAPVSQPSDETDSASAYRPFPGEKDGAAHKKMTPTAFTPTPKEGSAEVSYEKNVVKNSSAEGGAQNDNLASPGMAPPLRRRSATKKRGFFKRLFGIK